MDPGQAAVLGAVEGLTEFLPVSSTGHLILASSLLGLHGQAIKTFEVVIQAGALGAVIGLYRARVASLWRGCLGQDPMGRRLLVNLLISFVPAAVAGVLLHGLIKERLFSVWPVVTALALGGMLMIGIDRWLGCRSDRAVKTLDALTPADALVIGVAQCLSLWPGTSRAMVTMVAALCLGLPAVAAAEYSFLLALPTLGAATLFEAASGGSAFLQDASGLSIVCGFVTAGIVAALAIRTFIRYLTHRGLAPFGWYRVILAGVVWLVAKHP